MSDTLWRLYKVAWISLQFYWTCMELGGFHLISQLIIHQIFSLARDWSKRVTWANIPQVKLGNIIEDIPQFLKPMDNKHNNLNLAAKICSDICPWTLSVPRSSQFSSNSLLENCSLLGTDNVRGQISEHIFARNEGYCLCIPSYIREPIKTRENCYPLMVKLN